MKISYAALAERFYACRCAAVTLTAMLSLACGLAGANAAAGAPKGRGYEMVSPLDKNGAEIDRDVSSSYYSTLGAASSGNAVGYAALGQFAGIPSGAGQGQYRSVRGETGWSTRGINPPVEQYPSSEATAPYVWFLSEDLSRAVVSTNTLLTPSANLLGGSWGLYLQSNSGEEPSYQLLSLPADQLVEEEIPEFASNRFSFAGASRDLSHVVFDVEDRKLTPDGPETGQAVYEWADGQVRFVSKLPSGEPASNATAGFQSARGQFFPGDHLVSDDGQRIFFRDGIERSLYVREQGSLTQAVSVSERTGDDPAVPRDGEFMAAEAMTGSKALFRSVTRLTDDATACDAFCPGGEAPDLYLWDADAPAGSRLTDLTTGDPDGGGVLGLAAAADDMSRAYFVATGTLAAGAEAGSPNLYVWSAAEGVQLVAVLDEQDASVWSTQRDVAGMRYRDARIAADGGRMLFASRAAVTDVDSGGHMQVYLYDAGTGDVDCVSCGTGAVAGDAWLYYPPAEAGDGRMPYRLPRNLTSDGERAFFETAERLVDGDTNGKTDVYMWSEGELSLISTGQGAEGAEFIDASASGDDVFFTTREQLVGRDTDELVDVYDARVGGGFPDPPPPQPCLEDGCQGAFAPRPGLRAPVDPVTPGDPPSSRRPVFSVTRLSVAARHALAQGRSSSLSVRVNKPGRVAVRGRARVGGKLRTVLRASTRARAAGKVKLRLRLTKSAHRQLVRAGRLKVTLSVRFSNALEPRVMALTLRQTSDGKGSR